MKNMYDRELIIMYLSGNTYPIKEELKADGFRWDFDDKVWYKRFFLDEKGISREYVKNLATAFETTDGVQVELTGDL